MFKRILATCAILLMAGYASADTLTVDAAGDGMYTTIEAAIAMADDYDLITIADGIYDPVGTLNVNKPLTIEGVGTGAVINIPAAGGYGFSIYADDVTLRRLTINAVAGNEQYPIHASGTSNPPDGFDNLTIENVTVQGAHRRAGVDIHGYNHVVLSHLSSSDAWGGNGLQITGCTDVYAEYITTADNAWGSIAIYASQYLNRGSSDIEIDGDSCSLGEKNLFNQDEFGLFNTGITVTGYEYIVRNMVYREGAEGYWHYQDTQADALALAAALDGIVPGSYIIDIATGELLIVDGMLIQPAIDASDPGDALTVGPGTYEEQLHITTSDLTIVGAGHGDDPMIDTIILSPPELVWFFTTSYDNYPIVGVDGATGVLLQNMRIDGANRGDLNYKFQGVGFWNAGGGLLDVDIVNVRDAEFSGSQHGVGIYAYNDTGGPYEINLTSVNVLDYMKGGIAMNGAGLTANLLDCTTTGIGPTDLTAQNGIQFYGTVGGSIVNSSVSDNIYTGDGWAAAGILLLSAGSVEITDTDIANGDPCVYCQDTRADASGLEITNNHVDSGNGFYVRIDTGIDAKGGDLVVQAESAPFGDYRPEPDKASKGTATVTLDNSTLIGQTTGYGVSASNYITTDLIDLTVTNCAIKTWGWGAVIFGSGGEVISDFSDNGFIDNDGFFYAASALTSGQDASGNYWGTTDAAVLASGVILGNVDYTPWVGSGAEGFPGFTGDFSSLWVDDDSYQSGSGSLIQEALGLVSGSTINVAPGTYVESGQLVVGMNLEIIGDVTTRPIIMTDSDTGGSGDSRGWFLQSPGTHLVMQNLELDGAGHQIYQAIRSTGSGALTNCALRNITFPGYGGVALAAFGVGNWNVTGCTFDDIGRVGFLAFGAGLTNSSFSGNHYTGKGPGNWLDYACDISAGAVMTVEGNTITACQGVADSDGSTSGALLVSTYYGAGTTATINDNVLTGNSTGVAVGYDALDVSVVSGFGNDLSNNSSYGVSNTGANSVDFLGNWWGSASGPYHETLNPLGTGVPVGDNVEFDPWSGKTDGVIVPDTSGPLNCGESITLTFNYVAEDLTPDMFLYNAVVSATAGLDFGTVFDLKPFGEVDNNFFAMSTGPNQWTITGSTVGNPSSPVSGEGTTGLFTIVFSATGDVDGEVIFESLTLRDPENNTIPVDLSGASITYDCTAPAAVTGITAAPAHNKVDVSWTHDGTDVDHYEVFSGLWHDGAHASVYPEYDDVANTIPTRPVDYAAVLDNDEEWFDLGDFAALSTVQTWDAPVPRGVYYYEVFAVDAAGNASPAAAANDRATNYWLGDTSPVDGYVNVADITQLAVHFGTAVATGAAGAVVDVGPTDDWSRLGIPTTDSVINFEDLMIFSLNFGVVSDAKTTAPTISSKIQLAWVTYDDGSMALRLLEGSGLKGLNLKAAAKVNAVTAGALLDEQQEMTFLKNVGENLDVSLAVMGVDNGFRGTGDLLVIEADGPIAVEDLVIIARDTDNSELAFTLDKASGVLTPRVFALNPNYPNPFNPMTKISFSLPEAQSVRLSVYGVDGRKVVTLINEKRSEGLHEVLWQGRDASGRQVPSGTYFLRIEAGPYSQSRKMMLLK